MLLILTNYILFCHNLLFLNYIFGFFLKLFFLILSFYWCFLYISFVSIFIWQYIVLIYIYICEIQLLLDKSLNIHTFSEEIFYIEYIDGLNIFFKKILKWLFIYFYNLHEKNRFKFLIFLRWIFLITPFYWFICLIFFFSYCILLNSICLLFFLAKNNKLGMVEYSILVNIQRFLYFFFKNIYYHRIWNYGFKYYLKCFSIFFIFDQIYFKLKFLYIFWSLKFIRLYKFLRKFYYKWIYFKRARFILFLRVKWIWKKIKILSRNIPIRFYFFWIRYYILYFINLIKIFIKFIK